ncbi:odontogenesis associated phosphoprotein [Apodemus sylvaticus]|uniref:odontogenesis associated phosphoprotein n=1 Tax=Apodemus sylvaticus TaxID=10129 RepID=UPI002242C379|nr:odontogenesis associated phosphoprotein [Apodemus sylvaticus]
MAPGFHFSWFLVAWLVVAVAEGQDVVTPPGGSQNNMNPTDCQIITLTPPPTTPTTPTMRAQPVTRTPTVYFPPLPPRRPGFYPRFPNTPLFLPNNGRFQFWPLYLPPRGRLIPWRVFLGRRLQSRSSSEESTEK